MENQTPPTQANPLHAAAFFDLDKTVLAGSSALMLAQRFYKRGMITRRAALEAAIAQIIYGAAGADDARMAGMRDLLAGMVKGWSEEAVRECVQDVLDNSITPLVYREAVALLDDHHAAGRDVILLSASGRELVEPIGRMLGADHVVATRLDIVDGHYSGDVAYYAHGPAKAQAMADLAAERGYDLAHCFAYSDSISDLPMLEGVGHPFAVNPDRDLRDTARARDWPILVFQRPVAPAQARIVEEVKRPRNWAALGATAALGGIGIATALHHRRTHA